MAVTVLPQILLDSPKVNTTEVDAQCLKRKKRKKINVLLLIITNNNDFDWIKSYSSSQEQHFVFLDNYYLIKLIYKLYKAELCKHCI